MPEPFDLEALVRAARPEPAPAGAGRMARRVAERFPSPSRWWQWQTVRPNLQAISAVGAGIVVFVAIIGLASTTNHGSDDDAGSVASSSGSAKSSAPEAAVPRSGGGSATGSADM